jgi:hypothetical protein
MPFVSVLLKLHSSFTTGKGRPEHSKVRRTLERIWRMRKKISTNKKNRRMKKG